MATEIAFQTDAFQVDAFQVGTPVPPPIVNDRGDWPGYGHLTRPSREIERKRRNKVRIEAAIERAIEPRGPVRPANPKPWLFEPIEATAPLPIPEFNPAIVAAAERLRQIEAELALRKFNAEQEEADIELLLLSL